jgi:RNA polymerase sigma-70 factor (ECF subfamily)
VADLTADTFVQAITSFATFDPRKGTPRAWVFGIARRIYATHCQAHSQQRSRVERLAGRRELAPDEVGDLIDRIDAERAGRALVSGLAMLPVTDRAVTRHDNGTVTVAVYRASGVSGANVTLHAMGARVRVVPVRPGCPPIGSLSRPRPVPHPAVSVKSGVNGNGHRSVTVKLGKGGIPAGDTMILAFSGDPRHGTALGAGGIITGPVPRCVSLPSAPHGGS